MTKHRLSFDEEYDFQLIGICSSHSDYRLSWGINGCIGIQLTKSDDFVVMEKKEVEHLHSFYDYCDEEEHIEYYLIKNLSNNFQLLVPEKNQVDYFLIIKNNFAIEIYDILIRLKEIDSILTAFEFDPNELKSKAKLVF